MLSFDYLNKCFELQVGFNQPAQKVYCCLYVLYLNIGLPQAYNISRLTNATSFYHHKLRQTIKTTTFPAVKLIANKAFPCSKKFLFRNKTKSYIKHTSWHNRDTCSALACLIKKKRAVKSKRGDKIFGIQRNRNSNMHTSKYSSRWIHTLWMK